MSCCWKPIVWSLLQLRNQLRFRSGHEMQPLKQKCKRSLEGIRTLCYGHVFIWAGDKLPEQLGFGLKSLHLVASPTPSSHRICMAKMHKCICICMLGVFKMGRLKWVNTTASLNMPMEQSGRLCLFVSMDFRATLEGRNLNNVALRASNPTVTMEV